MAFFVDLGFAGRACWCNIDQIVMIEPAIHEGFKSAEPSKVVWSVVFSDGSGRGITEEQFERIMIVCNAPHR
jgi:hypothetical protein